MRTSSTAHSSSWKDLPERLIRLSSTLREAIETEHYQSDEDNLQFQIASKEIIAIKDNLHAGMAFLVFVEQQDSREILSRYLQHKLNAVEILKKDLFSFLKIHSIPYAPFSSSVVLNTSTTNPPLLPQQPESQNVAASPTGSLSASQLAPMNPLHPDVAEPTNNVLHKQVFIQAIHSFTSKIEDTRESYKKLYSKRDEVSKFILSNFTKVQDKLPQTTYTLERLSEIVRVSIQEVRQLIDGIYIDEKQLAKKTSFDDFKNRYTNIVSTPIIQFTAKLYKLVRELKTRTFAFSKSIVAFEKHLKDIKRESILLFDRSDVWIANSIKNFQSTTATVTPTTTTTTTTTTNTTERNNDSQSKQETTSPTSPMKSPLACSRSQSNCLHYQNNSEQSSSSFQFISSQQSNALSMSLQSCCLNTGNNNGTSCVAPFEDHSEALSLAGSECPPTSSNGSTVKKNRRKELKSKEQSESQSQHEEQTKKKSRSKNNKSPTSLLLSPQSHSPTSRWRSGNVSQNLSPTMSIKYSTNTVEGQFAGIPPTQRRIDLDSDSPTASNQIEPSSDSKCMKSCAIF